MDKDLTNKSKTKYLLIDGYNVINAWRDIFNLEKESLEECREKLLFILSNYEGYKKIHIIVVFDAHLVDGSKMKIEKYDNITVVFTREKQTADNYIERFVYKFGSENTIWVVTSDYMEQVTVLKVGGARITPAELRKEITSMHNANMAKNRRRNQHNERNTVISNIKPELAELLEKMRRDS